MYAPPARKLRAKLCPWLVYFFLTGCLDLFFPVLSAIFMWVFFFQPLLMVWDIIVPTLLLKVSEIPFPLLKMLMVYK